MIPTPKPCLHHRSTLGEPFSVPKSCSHDAESAEEQLLRLSALVANCRHDWYCLDHHSTDVLTLSVRLARYAGLDSDQISTIERGAYLHDVGKVFQPLSVILWPDKLSDAQWDEMRRHPAEGSELVTHGELRDVRRLIRCHHEWPGNPATGVRGGGGYPQGLSRADLKDEECLLSVADWYAGIREHRIYRPAKDHAVALKWTEEAAAAGKIDPDFTIALGRMLAESSWNPSSVGPDTSAHAAPEALAHLAPRTEARDGH